MEQGFRAVLRRGIKAYDFKGKGLFLQKNTQVSILVFKAGSVYSDGKGIMGIEQEDKFIATYGKGQYQREVTDLDFKTID